MLMVAGPVALGGAGCGRLNFDNVAAAIAGDAELTDSAFAPTTDAPPNAVTVRLGQCPGADSAVVVTDTFLDDTLPTQNFGGRYEMRIGNNRVSLLRFELGQIPTTASVFSATLEISVSPTDALEQGYCAISPLLEDWTEGSKDYSDGIVNWTQRTMTASWATAGAGAPGSRTSQVIGTFVPVLESVRHHVALDVSAVQPWIANPASNFGIVLYGQDEGIQGAWLATREASDPTLRPCIVITYVP